MFRIVGEEIGERFARRRIGERYAHEQHDIAVVGVEPELRLVLRIHEQVGFEHEPVDGRDAARRHRAKVEAQIDRIGVFVEAVEPHIEAAHFDRMGLQHVLDVGQADCLAQRCNEFYITVFTHDANARSNKGKSCKASNGWPLRERPASLHYDACAAFWMLDAPDFIASPSACSRLAFDCACAISSCCWALLLIVASALAVALLELTPFVTAPSADVAAVAIPGMVALLESSGRRNVQPVLKKANEMTSDASAAQRVLAQLPDDAARGDEAAIDAGARIAVGGRAVGGVIELLGAVFERLAQFSDARVGVGGGHDVLQRHEVLRVAFNGFVHGSSP
ncbi:conserved hypothetical protein [Paraburkholderia caribensis]|nr:conserved hypothetical protein [Paraburkholderia caribensis]